MATPNPILTALAQSMGGDVSAAEAALAELLSGALARHSMQQAMLPPGVRMAQDALGPL